MIPKGLFSQIAMMILSLAIIFTYVKPVFEEIGEVQDNIGTYKTELTKVETVNDRLFSFIDRLDKVSKDDERRLVTYLPVEVDDIAVQRDLSFIANKSGVILGDVSYQEVAAARSSNQLTEDDSLPDPHMFTLLVEGKYNQIKNLFSLLEQNNYPLEVHSVDMSQTEGGFLTADIRLVTYSYRNQLIDN